MSKHYIITGASRGFGQQLALRLAAGDTVLHLVARSESAGTRKMAEEKGGRCFTYSFDLTKTEAVGEVVQQVLERVNEEEADAMCLVNNAGTLKPIGPLGKYDAEAYRQNLELNYVAPLMLTHHFVQLLQKEDLEKRVVFISSGAAGKPYYGWTHYCSTKAGVNMFVQTLALEQESKPHPVKVMAFNPGRMETDMQVLIREQDADDFAEVEDFIASRTDGRMATPEEVSGVLAQLLQGDDFSNGDIVKARDLM